MVLALTGNALYQAICIKNKTCHLCSRLWSCMEIFMAKGIQPFLIQNSRIPKSVRLSIQFLLKMTGEHFLYFKSKLLAVVEGEQLQEMHLSGVERICLYHDERMMLYVIVLQNYNQSCFSQNFFPQKMPPKEEFIFI